jgi:hypothetical protein
MMNNPMRDQAIGFFRKILVHLYRFIKEVVYFFLLAIWEFIKEMGRYLRDEL